MAQKSIRARGRDYMPGLAWRRLGVEPVEVSELAENREILQVLQGSCPAGRRFYQRNNRCENE